MKARHSGATLTRLLVLAAVLVAILISVSGTSAATNAPTFLRADYPLFGNNYVAGDFNGDGSLDLAGVGTAAKVRLNNGAGAFGAVVDYAIGGQGQDLAAGDFNGDGRLDLVVTINDPQIGLSLLTGNGNGTFAAPVNFPNTSGSGSPAVAAVDLNNDAKLDVVIAHDIACFTAPCVNTDLISVMIGNGDGSFQSSREIPVGRGMSEIAVGDYNRDGFKDLAIGGTQGQVYLLHGVGDGTFVQQPTLVAVVDQSFIPVTDIDAADFNGDSIQDLVVSVPHNGSRTAILIGNGDGTFRTPLVLTSPQLNLPQQAAVADYNGDGFQDLALSLGDGSFGVMQIRNGNGDGTFQAAVHYLQPPPTSSVGGIFILSANLNGDTKPDIVLNIGGAFPSFAVLLNSTGATPPPTPSAPTLLSPAQDATPAQPVAFDWTDVAAATAYRIQIDDSNNFSAPLVVDRIVSASQFTASTLNAGRRHWWRVRGINAAGTAGAWSSVRRFTPGAFTEAPSLAGIALNPASVVGGNTSQGTASLTSAAPSGGAVLTLSSNTSVATVPASVTVPAGAFSATFSVSTASVTASTSATITGAFGGDTRSATLTVTPPPPPIGPASLSVSPATVEGGNPVTGTVFLSGGAPAGGLVVSLSSSNTAAATVPATMIVHGGLSSGTFPVSTLAGPVTRTTTITASANGVSRTADLTVTPSAAAALSTVAVNPASVTGGAASQGTVTLTSPAPAGGFAVSLSSGNTAATVPAGVSVAQGATSATFAIATSAVMASTPVTITASAGGVTRTATLTVNPQAQTATLTVTATGRSGERVTSTPTGIDVAVGSTGSASFPIGTAITLRATNERDVIWSGACSSGGSKTKTCTFTLSANAAATANVQ